MPVPVRYHLRSLLVRRAATGLTVLAVGFTVAMLVLVLALARGFELSLEDTGREDNIVFLRQGAMSEGVSVLDRGQARLLLARPEIARDEAGRARAAAELYAGINLERASGRVRNPLTGKDEPGSTNVTVRGTSETGLRIRDGVRVLEGEFFRPGTEEVVVGRALLGRVKGCTLGGAVEFAGRRLRVVGVLDSGGGAFDSEIWMDAEVALPIFGRQAFSGVLARLPDAGSVASVARSVAGDPRLPVKGMSEREYFRKQTGFLGTFLRAMAYFLAGIMAVGAVFGATNTLLASLAGRTREIGALLAMGYRPWHVRAGFLLEAILLGLLGGVAGVLLALPIHGVATGTTNWNTWTEQAFRFAITPDVAMQAVVFAAVVGAVGGILPALRAASLPPTEALRA